MFSFLIVLTQSKECTDLYSWQYKCEDGDLSNQTWAKEHCSNGYYWNQTCEVFDDVICTGNRTFIKRKWCPNQNGAHYGLAVLLSFFFGIFGVDRFYLGYHTYGIIKLFTCGMFLFGYFIDCILITFQIIGPADGSGYRALTPFPFLTRNNHRDIF